MNFQKSLIDTSNGFQNAFLFLSLPLHGKMSCPHALVWRVLKITTNFKIYNNMQWLRHVHEDCSTLCEYPFFSLQLERFFFFFFFFLLLHKKGEALYRLFVGKCAYPNLFDHLITVVQGKIAFPESRFSDLMSLRWLYTFLQWNFPPLNEKVEIQKIL